MFKYNDVKGSNLYDYWQHYIYHGIKEKRNIDYNTSVDVMQYTAQLERTAVIYVYYNRKNETRNETNLSFFIRQTVLKDTKRNILYLFIINNYDTEVVIPVQDNVIVLKNKNCFDFESYGLGINYLKNKYKKEFSTFNRLVLMNCGVSGPFYNGNNWLEKFENKLMQENSHACSSIIYKLDNRNQDFRNCKQPYRLPGYFVYLKLDDNILNILSNVLCYHNSKKNCIINGEYGIAKQLYKNNYKISCLTHVQNNLHIIPNRIDRDTNLDKYDIYNLVFVKSNWRWENDRDSVPILNSKIQNEINKICNFKNDTFQINYDILNCYVNGKCLYNSRYDWKSKKSFYNSFGKAEELIIYPTKMNHNSIALYAHSDSDNLFRDYCVQGVISLSQLGYRVIILTTCNSFKNIDNIPYEIKKYPESRVDSYMFKKYINDNYNELIKHDNILLINDSILFPIHGINNMRHTMNMMRNKSDYWGIWNSPEQKIHIMSPFIEFKQKMLGDLKNYINFSNPITYESGVNFEVNLVEYFTKLHYKYTTVVDYKSLGNLNYVCPIMHPDVFPRWINRSDVFAIKWKYMGNYLNKKGLKIPYMNNLLRFLHFNHTGIKGAPEKQNAYENPVNYLIK